MTAHKTKDSVTFGNYMVAFVDVLGQKEAMRKFKGLPETEEEMKEFTGAAKGTFGVVDGIRMMFGNWYNAFISEKEPPYPMTQEQRRDYQRLIRCEVKFQRFADTVVIYVPLGGEFSPMPIQGVYAALAACASTFFFSLAGKHPLRVGIEVGLAAEMYEGEIYGPALYEAYRLENEIAQYPRIVLGDELIRYLMDKSRPEGADIVAQGTRETAIRCLGLIAKDVDGYHILDYLGKGFRRVISKNIRRDELAKVQEFLIGQVTRWNQERNTKLSFRYALAIGYFLSRLPLWQEASD
jgi:hypothetical protein